MGLFADIKAIGAVQKIKNGGVCKLTIAQITGLLINLPDAEKNLSKQEFDQVYALFKEMRKCNTKMQMNIELYLDTAVKIIKEFDKIAPYEKYSGGNEIEFSFMMADIRGENYEEIRKLRETIAKMETTLQQKDQTDRENEQILAEAWSDEELNRMVSRGEFPADQVEAYKEQRATLEYVVRTAPQIRTTALKHIADLKKQLQELEQQ